MEFPKNQKIYDQLRHDPKAVADPIAKRLYEDGLADRKMPEEGDTFEWVCWVAGRHTRADRGIA